MRSCRCRCRCYCCCCFCWRLTITNTGTRIIRRNDCRSKRWAWQTSENAKSYADDILEECERVCPADESIIIQGESERGSRMRIEAEGKNDAAWNYHEQRRATRKSQKRIARKLYSIRLEASPRYDRSSCAFVCVLIRCPCFPADRADFTSVSSTHPLCVPLVEPRVRGRDRNRLLAKSHPLGCMNKPPITYLYV